MLKLSYFIYNLLAISITVLLYIELDKELNTKFAKD